jgi:hypothetical protein
VITTVLLADNAASGRVNLVSLGLDKRTTLVVADVDALHGFEPAGRVQVVDRTLHMPLRKYKAIQKVLATCQAKAAQCFNDSAIAEFAAALAVAVDARLQDALHCGEPAALLTAALLDELAEQVAPAARNGHLTRPTLIALSERVVADLPERIRTYRRETTPV